MAFDAHKNFAYSLVATAPSPASSGTSLVVTAADGAKFPAVPFNATIWPTSSQPTSANAEIVRVTARSTDTLTITRAQEGSSARTVIVGDQIAATITAKTITDIETPIAGITGSVSSTGVSFNSDTVANIYRSAASTIKTDASFIGSGYIYAATEVAARNGGGVTNVVIGSTGGVAGITLYDTTLTRVIYSGYQTVKAAHFLIAALDVVGRAGDTTQASIGYTNGGYAGIAFGSSSDAYIYRTASAAIRTNSALTVDGAVTASNITLNTAAKLKLAANTTTATGSNTINLDTVSFDPGSNLSTSNHWYVVPVTGIYSVAAMVSGSGTNTPSQRVYVAISVGGVEKIRGEDGTVTLTDYFAMVAAGLVSCTAGDHITVVVYNSGASAINIAGGNEQATWLTAVRVG